MFRLSRQVSPDGLTYTFARDKLPALFYADVSPEDRYRAMERLRPQPLSISTTPVTLTEERFGSVPRWYIECTHDNAVRINLQRLMVKMTPCKVITMECGHSPFFSNPRNWSSTSRRSRRPSQSKKAKARASMLWRGLAIGRRGRIVERRVQREARAAVFHRIRST